MAASLVSSAAAAMAVEVSFTLSPAGDHAVRYPALSGVIETSTR